MVRRLSEIMVEKVTKKAMEKRKGKEAGKAAEKLTRFSVAMPEALLSEFDLRLSRMGMKNRSDALRGLVRRYIAEERWKGDSEVYGTVTIVYDHHVPTVTRELTAVQHDHGSVILCSTHVHVTHETCLECVILRGAASKIQEFFDGLRAIRGIRSMDTVITSGA